MNTNNKIVLTSAVIAGGICIWIILEKYKSSFQHQGIKIINPYQPKNNIYKGQLHCHTINSDGSKTPSEVMTSYKNAGYHFVSITDHNFVTPDPGVEGILHIPGVEENANQGMIQAHVNGINVKSDKFGTMQEIIDAILSDDAIPILNHPNYPNSSLEWSYAELDATHGYTHIEVYNGVSGNYAIAEDKWDYLLTKEKKIFGVATDDSHSIALNRGWINVFADQLTIQDIMSSLKTGNFYASTGPTLSVYLSDKTIFKNSNMLSTVTDSPSTIQWIGNNGTIYKYVSNAISDSYQVRGDEMYIRIKIIRDSDNKMAWSNPLFIINRLEYQLDG